MSADMANCDPAWQYRTPQQRNNNSGSPISADMANCDPAWQYRKKVPPELQDLDVAVRSCGCPAESPVVESGPVPCMEEFHTEREEYVCLRCNKEAKRKFGCRTCVQEMQRLNITSTGIEGVAGCFLGRCFSPLDARPLYIVCTNGPGGMRANQFVAACTSDSKFVTVEQCKQFELPMEVPPEQAVGPVGESDWSTMHFKKWNMQHYHPKPVIQTTATRTRQRISRTPQHSEPEENATRPRPTAQGKGKRGKRAAKAKAAPAKGEKKIQPPHFLYPRLRGRRVENCGALAYFAQQRTGGVWQWMTSTQLFHTCGQPAIKGMEMFDRWAVGLCVLMRLAFGWCVSSY